MFRPLLRTTALRIGTGIKPSAALGSRQFHGSVPRSEENVRFDYAYYLLLALIFSLAYFRRKMLRLPHRTEF